jgi:hypothetical protein
LPDLRVFFFIIDAVAAFADAQDGLVFSFDAEAASG